MLMSNLQCTNMGPQPAGISLSSDDTDKLPIHPDPASMTEVVELHLPERIPSGHPERSTTGQCLEII
jgi:hypothetical protein